MIFGAIQVSMKFGCKLESGIYMIRFMLSLRALHISDAPYTLKLTYGSVAKDSNLFNYWSIDFITFCRENHVEALPVNACWSKRTAEHIHRLSNWTDTAGNANKSYN